MPRPYDLCMDRFFYPIPLFQAQERISQPFKTRIGIQEQAPLPLKQLTSLLPASLPAYLCPSSLSESSIITPGIIESQTDGNQQ